VAKTERGEALRRESYPDWSGRTAAVIACGPSARETLEACPALEKAHSQGQVKVVVVNRACELAPWADVLYAADFGFWQVYKDAHSFKGLKLAVNPYFPYIEPVFIARDKAFKRLNIPVRGPIGTVGGGGNSTFQAVNLAAQFGAKRILLIGVDMIGSHFHPDHKPPLRNPDPDCFQRWRKFLDDAAPIYASWGCTIINCSPISTVSAYPKLTLEEALALI
jgi:hypothetical protein